MGEKQDCHCCGLCEWRLGCGFWDLRDGLGGGRSGPGFRGWARI